MALHHSPSTSPRDADEDWSARRSMSMTAHAYLPWLANFLILAKIKTKIKMWTCK
jgi:hypothetical protein